MLSCRVSLRKLVFVSLTAVGLSLVLCVTSGVYLDFQRVTYTHCQSYEILPSISAAIDDSGYHRALWQVPITLHCVERALVTCLSYSHHGRQTDGAISTTAHGHPVLLRLLNFATTATGIISLVSLFLLSFLTSTLNYPIHRLSVILFMLITALQMLLSACLHWLRERRSLNTDANGLNRRTTRRLLHAKVACFAVDVIAIAVGSYWYLQHSAHCVDYSYSYFALCEYMVVAACLAFHYTCVLDLPRMYISVGPDGEIT